jgi:hypothetical protein
LQKITLSKTLVIIKVSAKLQKSKYVDEIPKKLNPPKT